MNRFQRFMYGRYGFDQLTRFLVVIAFIISLLSSFTRVSVLLIFSYLILFYALFRVFSKNISARTRENYRYVGMTNLIKNRFHKLKRTFFGTKTHKYYLCPKCKQTIRVPKGKGRICISCPKCRYEFIKKT